MRSPKPALLLNFMEHKVTKIKLSPEEAFHKIKIWCAYQERSQSETLQKLTDFGLNPEEAGTILAELISENFVNEVRFATSLASGKFRIKNWGRYKIKNALREHGVSDNNISRALESLDENAYLKTLQTLIIKKLKNLSQKNDFEKEQHVMRFLISRGFEASLVKDQLKKILRENK